MNGASTPSPLAEYPALTSLRFLAALLVLLFHFPPSGDVWGVVAGEGHIGVGIFFVLSGFLITYRYGGAIARGEASLSRYFLRRAARILPLYYFVFIASQLLSHRRLSFAPALWPEWTLTQAFFGESLGDLVIQTSWSLTVEECFYALAPLLFLLVLARGGEAPSLLRAAALLFGIALGLHLAGAALWTVLDGRGPGMLRSPEHVSLHTIFGRFYDFAVGILAALAVLSPRTARWRAGAGRPAVAALLTIAALALIVAAQYGMSMGGVGSPKWVSIWAWGYLVAPASALLIVSLMAAGNPFVVLLATAPCVYLGKVSYALYLIQLTPLGRGFVASFLSRQPSAGVLLLLYAGLVAMSALLFELVEEPARRAILRRFGVPGREESEARPSSALRWATAGLLAALVAWQWGSYTLTSLTRARGAVSLTEITEAGVDPGDVTRADLAAEPGRVVRLPAAWGEPGRRLRAPRPLRVFADGTPIPFFRHEPDPGTVPAAAFYRGPAAAVIGLHLPESVRELVVVRDTLPLSLRLTARRLASSPGDALMLLVLVVAMLAAAPFLLRGAVSARGALSLAFCLAVLWWALRLHEAAWAGLLVVAECVVVLGFAIVRGGARLFGGVRMKELLVLAAVLLTSACTETISTPPPPATASPVTFVVFYDENGNGAIDAAERVRFDDARVESGSASARTDAGGRATLSLPDGRQTASVDAASLPPYFTGRTVSVTAPREGDVALAVTLPIGDNRRHTYMGFGDSLTSKTVYLPELQARLEAQWGVATMVNEGLFATRSGEGMGRIDEALYTHRPAYTLILYGTNDWRDAACRTRLDCGTVENLLYMIAATRARQSLPVLATLPPVDADGSRPAVPPERNSWIAEINVRIRQLAADEGVLLVDLEPAFFAQPSLSALFVDKIHPSADGSVVMADTFFDRLVNR
jgi:peptidoglycan/LPS O-acetylase OafA/YrhL/lysophospholipase L1-like esterase